MINIFWPYESIDSISDQLWCLRTIFDEYKIPHTISSRLDPLSHNLMVEAVNNSVKNYIIQFCNFHNKKIIILATEFLTANSSVEYSVVNNSRISDLLLSELDKSGSNFGERFLNLSLISQQISAFISVLGEPPLEEYKTLFGINNIFRLYPSLNYEFALKDIEDCAYDLYFSGTLTQYRIDKLEELKKQGYSIYIESKFVSDQMRSEHLNMCKFNLNLPQNEFWKWPSPMRILFGARNKKLNVIPLRCSENLIKNENLYSLPNSYCEFDSYCNELVTSSYSTSLLISNPNDNMLFKEFLNHVE